MKETKVKFNFIDILIVLVIVAVLAVGWMFINGRGGTSATTEFTYDILFREVPDEFVASIRKDAAVFDGVKIINIGSVKEFTQSDAIRYEFNSQTGEYVETKVPEKYDVTLTVSASGSQNELSYSVNEYEIYVGKTADIKSTGIIGHGVIVAVNEVAQNEE